MFSLFLLFLLVGFVIHLLVRHFFNKKNFVDEPDGVKKQHDMAVPISGGLSFGLSYSLFIFAFLLRNEIIKSPICEINEIIAIKIK